MSSIQKDLALMLPIFEGKKNPEKYGLKMVLFQTFMRKTWKNVQKKKKVTL